MTGTPVWTAVIDSSGGRSEAALRCGHDVRRLAEPTKIVWLWRMFSLDTWTDEMHPVWDAGGIWTGSEREAEALATKLYELQGRHSGKHRRSYHWQPLDAGQLAKFLADKARRDQESKGRPTRPVTV